MPRRSGRRNLVIDLTVNSAQARRELRQAQRDLDDFSTGVSRGAQVAAAALAALGAGAASAAIQHETALTRLRSLVGLTEGEVTALSDSIDDAARRTGTSVADLTAATFDLTSAGLRGADANLSLKVAAEGAAIGLGETKDIAEALTSVMGAYGAANLSARESLDVLVATIRYGRLDAASLAGEIGRLTGFAAELGVEFDQVGGALAALSLTLDAPSAATGIRGIFGALLKPTQEAITELDRLGLTVDGLRTKFDTDFFGALTSLRGAGADLAQIFPDRAALLAVSTLTGTNSEALGEVYGQVLDSEGVSANAYALSSRTTQAEINREWESVQIQLRRLGDQLLPILSRYAGSLGGISEAALASLAVVPGEAYAVGAAGLGLFAASRSSPVRALQGYNVASGFTSASYATAFEALPAGDTAARSALDASVTRSASVRTGLGLAGGLAIGTGLVYIWQQLAKEITAADEAQSRFSAGIDRLDPNLDRYINIETRIAGRAESSGASRVAGDTAAGAGIPGLPGLSPPLFERLTDAGVDVEQLLTVIGGNPTLGGLFPDDRSRLRGAILGQGHSGINVDVPLTVNDLESVLGLEEYEQVYLREYAVQHVQRQARRTAEAEAILDDPLHRSAFSSGLGAGNVAGVYARYDAGELSATDAAPLLDQATGQFERLAASFPRLAVSTDRVASAQTRAAASAISLADAADRLADSAFTGLGRGVAHRDLADAYAGLDSGDPRTLATVLSGVGALITADPGNAAGYALGAYNQIPSGAGYGLTEAEIATARRSVLEAAQLGFSSDPQARKYGAPVTPITVTATPAPVSVSSTSSTVSPASRAIQTIPSGTTNFNFFTPQDDQQLRASQDTWGFYEGETP